MVTGIDPDVKLNGLAEYDSETNYFNVRSIGFFDLYEFLKENKPRIELVRIEGGWLNSKSNFHYYGQNTSIAARVAKNVGSNHEAGRKIGEMCEYLGIDYEIVKPIGTKQIDHFTFCRITGFKGRTNQDMRDAGMLVYGFKINKKYLTY